ncbi:hypothetical protein FKW77_002523 [Venturia effusa]|uniref:alpha,alpha-trehalase n=1 Tax=Venturia effusa TaxID=50376 RepID=A0A517LII5_9PEZI|nr:hypothetical protein FKW77_002523 [Venturia effusa]
MVRLSLAFVAALIPAQIICSKWRYHTGFDNVTWDDEDWKLTTSFLDQGHYRARKSLSNGYIGINLAALGPFFEVDEPVDGDNINGWPLFDRRQTFATIAGFYASVNATNGTNYPWLLQYGGESVIAGVPHWGNLMVESNGNVLYASTPPEQISGFSSTMDHKSGTLSWSYTWMPPGAVALGIEYTMLVHKLYVNTAAVRLKINATQDTNVTIIDAFNGDCAVRSEVVDKGLDNGFLKTAVHPHWIPDTTAYVYSTLRSESLDMSTSRPYKDTKYIGGNISSIARAISAEIKRGETTSISKFIGVASTDAFPDPNATARNASLAGAKLGFDALLQEQRKEWQAIMPRHSVDNYVYHENRTLPTDFNIIRLQITAVTNPFNLLQNTIGANAIKAAGDNAKLDVWSIPVCGLGSSCYAGGIFWDADVWMAPGLMVSHPKAAKQISNFRVKQFPQAQRNIYVTGSTTRNTTKFHRDGAIYPWISGKYGNCTAMGPCFDYEYHISGDVSLNLLNEWAVTGDVDTFRTLHLPIYDSVASMYSDLLEFNQTVYGGKGGYTLLNATDPDEYANNVDNAAFTMVLIKTHLLKANKLRLQFGMEPNQDWAVRGDNTYIPIDPSSGITKEYETMNGTISVKQADVVLVDDLLDFDSPNALINLDYYAGRQSLNGPGMTYGVYSIVANEISPSGCSSYTYNLYGSFPYIREPWFEYSEQTLDNYNANGGTHPAFPFLTGMGGAARVAIYGYLGLRLMVDSLNIDPDLPPAIPELNYRVFFWQGHAINATSNQTHTTLARLPLSSSLTNANPIYVHGSIPVTRGSNKTKIADLLPSTFSTSGPTVTIPNRGAHRNLTIPGNIAQCQMVESEASFMSGQFPLSAVDGAVSTKWQPVIANKTATLKVELLAKPQPIHKLSFDWGSLPPVEFNVTFSNTTIGDDDEEDSEPVTVVMQKNVKISLPYNESEALAIVQYVGNTTDVILDPPVWSGNIATLTIWGAQRPDWKQFTNGSGATVAEFAIIGPDGKADLTLAK